MEKARGMLTTNPSPPKVLLEEGGPCTIRCAHSEARKPRGASHSISQPAGAEGPALRRRVSSDEFQRVSNSSFPCLQNEEIVVRRPRGKPVAGDSSHRDIGAEAKQRERGRGNPASICFCLYRVSVWPASPGAEDGRYRFCWIPFAPDAGATQREAEAQAEGEAGSLRGARGGTRSQDPGVTPGAQGRCCTTEPPALGIPQFYFLDVSENPESTSISTRPASVALFCGQVAVLRLFPLRFPLFFFA
ncbi:uncharacterized protein LOC112650436 isoform X3 [Canis lupus dingo]|uniref:uncharacterized protein LOC112650436 isoform X3 n=1 Tax=Canis lupus dingo TaxID=286419 RepID=UPI0015F1A893|nr:uncharacterized protein LOC112650436 isoform X3 [Canis lupus dingo]